MRVAIKKKNARQGSKSFKALEIYLLEFNLPPMIPLSFLLNGTRYISF